MNKHGYRGVSWHSRYGKYEAKMLVGGRKVCLGSFATAAEAGEAYRAARAKTPALEPDKPTAYGESVTSVVRAVRGDASLPVGHSVTVPGGQAYELVRREVKAARDGRSYLVQHWRSACRICGEAYECTLLPQSKGLIRTCEEHRGLKRVRASGPRKAARAAEGVPLALLGREVLGRLHREARERGCELRELEEYQAIAAQAQALGKHVREVAEVWDLV